MCNKIDNGKLRFDVEYLVSPAMHLLTFNSSQLMLIGNWLSGLDNVHWFIYLCQLNIIAALTGLVLVLRFQGRF